LRSPENLGGGETLGCVRRALGVGVALEETGEDGDAGVV
jgi:hypothetical protein